MSSGTRDHGGGDDKSTRYRVVVLALVMLLFVSNIYLSSELYKIYYPAQDGYVGDISTLRYAYRHDVYVN